MECLQVGDLAPRFVFTDSRGMPFDLHADSIAGRIIVVVFYRTSPATINVLGQFAEFHAAFEELGATIVAVGFEDPNETINLNGTPWPFTMVPGPTTDLFHAYGANLEPCSLTSPTMTVLIRPNGHVLHILNGASQASDALKTLGEFSKALSTAGSGYHPPVLIVPDVLTASDCAQLIAAYNDSQAPFVKPSEILGQESDVKTRVPDYGRQDRIDLMLNSSEIRDLVVRRLQHRLLPEIKKAFHYEVTSLESLRIAKYEGARGGKSHGHRDNSTENAVHRRFAVSINLNSEEFEGGELRFPEFGPRRYRPETGAAIAFSCSLLHEALEVQEGARYVLLVFLFGDQ